MDEGSVLWKRYNIWRPKHDGVLNGRRDFPLQPGMGREGGGERTTMRGQDSEHGDRGASLESRLQSNLLNKFP